MTKGWLLLLIRLRLMLTLMRLRHRHAHTNPVSQNKQGACLQSICLSIPLSELTSEGHNARYKTRVGAILLNPL